MGLELDPPTLSKMDSWLLFVFVMPVTVLNSKPGEERSCLQREVPSTPHPTIAMSLLDAKLLGREKADAGDSKQSNKKNDVIAAMV